ncbi:MAG: AsmA family protein [Caldimonas sp.]
MDSAPRRFPPLALPRGLLARVALSLAALLLALVALQPWWLAPLLVRYMARDGRTVRLDSATVGLSARLEPVVRFRGVNVDNAAWADDPARPFAALGEAIAIVSWRSLAEARPVIARLILRDGSVDLQRQADGLRNWRLRNPQDRGPGLYKVLALQAERLSLRFRHGGIDLDLVAKATPNLGREADAAAMPTRIDAQGAWRSLPFTASVATGPVLTFLETGSTFPIDGGVDAGGARLDAAGHAGDLFRAPVLDARVVLAGDSLAPFRAFLGPRHDASKKPFRIEGRVEANPQVYALHSAQARVGASDFAGDVAWARQERPMLRATLHSDAADVADLLWLAGRGPGAAARSSKATAIPHAATAKRAAPEPADKHDFLRATDASLRIDLRHLRAAEAPWMRSLAVEAELADGVLKVPKFDAGVAQAGHATGRLDVDLRVRPYAGEADVALRGLRLETMFGKQPEDKRVTGLLQVDAHLSARGDSVAALRDTATGSVRANVRGGSMPGLLDAKIGLQGFRVLRSLIAGSDRVAIRCAAAVIDLRGGVGRVRSLVLDTERTRTIGSGQIDLGASTIDLLLTPEAKQGGLLVLDRSIRLHGPLMKPAREMVSRADVKAGERAACAG